jgi:hypothetical protein
VLHFLSQFSNWFFGAEQKMMLIPIRGEILLLKNWQDCILDFGPIQSEASSLRVEGRVSFLGFLVSGFRRQVSEKDT